MIYFDTSYVLKCYVNEAGSEAVKSFASRYRRIACCEYGRMELFAAFHRCLRERRITKDQFDVIVEQYEIDEASHLWSWLPLTQALIANVIRVFRTLSPETYLRTGDAVHLVCARDHGIGEVYSNDSHLLSAAAALKLDARNVIPG